MIASWWQSTSAGSDRLLRWHICKAPSMTGHISTTDERRSVSVKSKKSSKTIKLYMTSSKRFYDIQWQPPLSSRNPNIMIMTKNDRLNEDWMTTMDTRNVNPKRNWWFMWNDLIVDDHFCCSVPIPTKTDWDVLGGWEALFVFVWRWLWRWRPWFCDASEAWGMFFDSDRFVWIVLVFGSVREVGIRANRCAFDRSVGTWEKRSWIDIDNLLDVENLDDVGIGIAFDDRIHIVQLGLSIVVGSYLLLRQFQMDHPQTLLHRFRD